MIFKTKIPPTEICGLFNVACEQALLFGRVKRVSRERVFAQIGELAHRLYLMICGDWEC